MSCKPQCPLLMVSGVFGCSISCSLSGIWNHGALVNWHKNRRKLLWHIKTANTSRTFIDMKLTHSAATSVLFQTETEKEDKIMHFVFYFWLAYMLFQQKQLCVHSECVLLDCCIKDLAFRHFTGELWILELCKFRTFKSLGPFSPQIIDVKKIYFCILWEILSFLVRICTKRLFDAICHWQDIDRFIHSSSKHAAQKCTKKYI